jgi:hypothetical protein
MSPIIGTISGSRGFGRGATGGAFIIASGGSITQVDGYRIHTFASGTSSFSVTSAPTNATVEVLVVGGGGPGGNGLAGGGGGGAVIHNLAFPISAGSYNVVVGAQSPQASAQSNITGSAPGRGYDSTFGNLTALGGGIGGWWDGVAGQNGGCGGGGSGGRSNDNRGTVAGGNAQTGTNVFANPGGIGIRYPANNDNAHAAGGGGGAGTPGRNWTEYQGVQGADSGADGGGGYLCSIDGTARYWAGGGGGSCWQNSWAGRGGLGGGGGGNVANSSGLLGTGGGGALNSGGGGATNGGDGGTNTGGGGGGSSGNPWNRGPGGVGGSGIVIVRYPYLDTAPGVSNNLGLTEATAAESAVAIKRAWAGAPDRAYWIKPTGQTQAYLVHCLMSIEGGGWELAWRNNSREFGPFGSGVFLVGNWAGWAWNTKSQVDTIGNYSYWGDTNAFAPTYYARDFTDCMIISNRRPSDRRVGARWNTGFSSLLSVINTNIERRATSILFGTLNLPQTLATRGDTNVGYAGGTFFAFKSGSDSNNPGDNTGLTGGAGGVGWTRFQVGVGRDNQNSNFFGGGFGAISTSGPTYHRFSGHFWGHGDGRNGSAWSGDRSSPFEGQAFYVRKEAP